MARKKKDPPKPIPDNVIAIPVQNKRITGKLSVYTCDRGCGGQNFILFQNGHVTCTSCRKRQSLVRMKLD
jgi:hypothetical protein